MLLKKWKTCLGGEWPRVSLASLQVNLCGLSSFSSQVVASSISATHRNMVTKPPVQLDIYRVLHSPFVRTQLSLAGVAVYIGTNAVCLVIRDCHCPWTWPWLNPEREESTLCSWLHHLCAQCLLAAIWMWSVYSCLLTLAACDSS